LFGGSESAAEGSILVNIELEKVVERVGESNGAIHILVNTVLKREGLSCFSADGEVLIKNFLGLFIDHVFSVVDVSFNAFEREIVAYAIGVEICFSPRIKKIWLSS
jgi:hypothetical protein